MVRLPLLNIPRGRITGGNRFVAALSPPELSGLYLQDGFTDMYREVGFRGGVPHMNSTFALDEICRPHGNRSGALGLDMTRICEEHPHYDEVWQLFTPQVDRIQCPLYIVSSLADNAIHTPGTIRGG